MNTQKKLYFYTFASADAANFLLIVISFVIFEITNEK
jgi:hypothetical protein